MWRAYVLVGAVGLLSLCFVTTYRWAHNNGRELERGIAAATLAALNDELATVSREASKREALRLTQMAELEQHIDELRSAIDADPDADRPAFGPDSVRRLNSVQ